MRAPRLALLWFAAVVAPATAGTVYKCTDARGHVSYQDTPCAPGRRQQRLFLAETPPATPPAPAPAAPPPVPAAPVTPRRPAIPPPPRLYRCVRATDGKTYLSHDGHPPPYLAPLGMLGVIRQPLAEVYGSAQGAGVGLSAPELATRPSPALVGGYMTPVRDACQPLSPRAACIALQAQHDANEAAIRKAFESDRAPLRKRRERLDARMAGCPGHP